MSVRSILPVFVILIVYVKVRCAFGEGTVFHKSVPQKISSNDISQTVHRDTWKQVKYQEENSTRRNIKKEKSKRSFSKSISIVNMFIQSIRKILKRAKKLYQSYQAELKLGECIFKYVNSTLYKKYHSDSQSNEGSSGNYTKKYNILKLKRLKDDDWSLVRKAQLRHNNTRNETYSRTRKLYLYKNIIFFWKPNNRFRQVNHINTIPMLRSISFLVNADKGKPKKTFKKVKKIKDLIKNVAIYLYSNYWRHNLSLCSRTYLIKKFWMWVDTYQDN